MNRVHMAGRQILPKTIHCSIPDFVMIPYSRWAGGPMLQMTWRRSQTCPGSHSHSWRLYSTAPAKSKSNPKVPSQRPSRTDMIPKEPISSKQIPVISKPTMKHPPVVQRKPREPLAAGGQITAFKSMPESDQKGSGVFAPRVRLTIGVFLVGSIVYSMLTSPLQLTEAPSILGQDTDSKRESGVTSNSPMRLRMEAFVQAQQSAIVSALESLEPTHKFRTDTWTRPAGGGGISCVLQGGDVFEKAGVNTSVVYGTLPRSAVQQMRVNHKALDPDAESLKFFAAGLSVVLHPQNPMAPTVHLNYRYFETINPDGTRAWWFGGGTDLTPSYLFDEDAIHFHKTIKDTCDKHDHTYYPRFKQWCDKYFHIPHRAESRGVGGIFFDDLDSEEDAERLFSFVKHCALAFLPSYLPIIQRRKDMPYTEQEKEWQQLRRGRYVEFNLVNDRGTRFGLTTPNARVESILMSLPLTAKWMYVHEPEKGSREERLLEVLKNPVTWVSPEREAEKYYKN